ncbi:KilA domain-containing protein [Streptococcus pneumoniae]|nr:KilA domain-containing protein [Streptococcus pneumoniae]VKI71881.1 KilA domain-containing protein [Streptococcus pneumoniae]VKJ28003.1 KilA domain-containing protein [Streptococcus pneumoniae]VKS80616.1 KilA domain-containing protein [Streptococcus pneumoniae]VLR19721.1 KilA domain-containing protein [Streptococcus pneumoniae]
MVKINANGKEITLLANNTDYVSLTDIAKYLDPENPRFIIQNWMRNRNTIEFLGAWESINNPNFNRLEFDTVRNASGTNAFVLTPQRWIAETNAIGITSKAGRYGGTYAHSDIAFEFASWISPEFKLYIIQDYQRLKQEEAYRNQLDWQVNRYISKLNYTIQTDAIKENIVPTLQPSQISYAYSSEADLVNVALFGMTAKQYKKTFPEKDGNQRDNATIEQLLVLNNLQSLNAEMIKQGLSQSNRLTELNRIAKEQLEVLYKNNQKALDNLKRLADK